MLLDRLVEEAQKIHQECQIIYEELATVIRNVC